jgi:hypothetical protein
MSAPERIWVEGAVSGRVWEHDKQSCLSPHEYIRADAAEAALAQAVKALREIGKTYFADGSRLIHSDKQIINMVYIALAEIEGEKT